MKKNSDNKTQEILEEARKKESKAPDDILSIEEKGFELYSIGTMQKISLQKTWSWIIGGILIGSTFCAWQMILRIGLGELDYSQYPWFPHTVVGSFFGTVVGLAIIVAKYLFPSRSNS